MKPKLGRSYQIWQLDELLQLFWVFFLAFRFLLWRRTAMRTWAMIMALNFLRCGRILPKYLEMFLILIKVIMN